MPDPRLRPYVRLLWSVRAGDAGEGSEVENIVPDGCPEIVINRADPFQRLHEGEASERQARVLLAGQLQRPIQILPTGVVDLVGIRFEPGGLHALLGIPMHELLDEAVCVTQVERRLHDRLERSASSAHAEECFAAIQELLGCWLEGRGRRGVELGVTRAAIGLVEEGCMSVDGMAGSLGVNRRLLERLFRTEVGLSPKLYARIRRLQSVLERVDGGTGRLGWAEIALEHGFTDQSHLIRDFRLLAGRTPERYLAERTDLAGFMETPDLSHSSNP